MIPEHVSFREAALVEPLACVVMRSGQEPVVVNLDLPEVEPNPEEVHWVDDIHRSPGN